jgi:D-alanine-D-alanine ligase
VGILGTGSRAKVIGAMEVAMRKADDAAIYSFNVKEMCEELVDYSRPARTPEIEAVERLALESYKALELRDGGRVDIRMDRLGRPAFMEVNPLPGLHPHHSDLPMIATQEGMTYPDLIGAIVNSALDRAAASP